MLKKFLLILFFIPFIGFSQSQQTSKAIETIKDLSYEETTYGVSEVNIIYKESTGRIEKSSEINLGNGYIQQTYKYKFYLDDLDPTSLNVKIDDIMDNSYSVQVEVYTKNGNSIEFYNRDVNPDNPINPIIKTEYLNKVRFSANNKLLSKSLADRYVEQVKVLLGINLKSN